MGILKAALRDTGIPSSVSYANIWFAETLGMHAYWFTSVFSQADLLGEWTFSRAAFPDFTTDDDTFMETAELTIRKIHDERKLKYFLCGRDMKDVFREIRDKAGLFVDQAARRLLSGNPRVVGCGSMFQQHCASLALLRRIRELAPDVVTVMGGANCEGEMGLATHQLFDWVDFVVSGDAEEALPQLCRLVLERGRAVEPGDIPQGIWAPHHRGQPGMPSNYRILLKDLNTSPIPDYSDYFETIRVSEVARYVNPGQLVETSRGCWWGQKHPCSFCGLIGEGAQYRPKTPARALQEYESLTRLNGVNCFMAVDNIMDMEYFKTVLPALKEAGRPYTLMYEIKANLSRDQVRLLSEAGVRWVQPGLESLSDHVLKLLNKGTTILMNIQLLKWAREFGIYVTWNILQGIPGDADEDYGDMATMIPSLVHLQPPMGLAWIEFERFSVYHSHPERFGLKLVPRTTYSHIYPLSREQISRLAYYFEDSGGCASGSNRGGPGITQLQRSQIDWLFLWIRWWRNGDDYRVVLTMDESESGLHITDTRPCAMQHDTTLTGLEALVYSLCDKGPSVQGLLDSCRQSGYSDASLEQVQAILKDFKTRRLVLELNDRVLSLATRKADVPPVMAFPGGDIRLEEMFGATPLNINYVQGEDPRDQTLGSWLSMGDL
ncbi:MAG: RiPP maturation radical SAM C-methyltransferase [Kiritimatiellae bacterium]|nr:RiPP maturation radical SAM C-methyltransferase [Kiritimatiellia bacterium]